MRISYVLFIFLASNVVATANFAPHPVDKEKSKKRLLWRIASLILNLPLEKWRYLKEDLIERGTCR